MVESAKAGLAVSPKKTAYKRDLFTIVSSTDVSSPDMKKAASTFLGCGAAASLPDDCSRQERLFRTEENTSELQSLIRISYAVFCLKKNKEYTNKQDIQAQQN